ncbi:MAG: hypothetical protein MZV70_77110 [Desulfobacterales bacterium]|nr:hypothetical protein [Desulfobacterales bacterium]
MAALMNWVVLNGTGGFSVLFLLVTEVTIPSLAPFTLEKSRAARALS